KFQREKQSLYDEKELYDLVFKNSHNSVLLLDIEKNVFYDLNKNAVNILKLRDKKEVLNLSPSQLSPEYQPDGQRSDEKSVKMNTLAEKKGSHSFDWQHLDVKGNPFWVRVTLTPINIHGRKVLHVIWDDIETRKIKEEKLFELFSNNVIASSSDLEGNITYASHALCEISGYSEDELLGKNHRVLKSKDTPKTTFKDLWNTILSGKTWKGELKNNKKNGGYYWVRATVEPEFDKDNKIIGYRSVRQDISAEKAKEQFLANMSHELRTPLNAILGFIEIIKNQTKEKTTLEYSEIINKSGKDLLYIIEDILDFSKMESGKLEVEKISFNPKAELSIVANLFGASASEKNITLEFDIDSSVPTFINSDPHRIKQVISNLVSNAIKFTPRGKKIFVKVTYDDETLMVSVIDEGKGIAKDKIESVFEAFQQEESSITREFGGTGLGLSISRELIKLLGGELKVKSTLGKGSEFYFNIPAKNVALLHDVDAMENKEYDFSDVKVLIAEDNKANQMFMSLILENLNVENVIVDNGLEAFKEIQNKKYDMIFMDENMPVMGGIEATAKILEYEKSNKSEHTPIVALTANALKGDKEKFLASGMDDYATKPINTDKVSNLIAYHTGKK
ncbi:MAG: ATP-binding protein, partial [Thiovulaceae bacterium]|nr:ATP-binding protein [Sulfurimonadaceae bacterium]